MISAPGPRTEAMLTQPGQPSMVAVVVNVPGSDADVAPMAGSPSLSVHTAMPTPTCCRYARYLGNAAGASLQQGPLSPFAAQMPVYWDRVAHSPSFTDSSSSLTRLPNCASQFACVRGTPSTVGWWNE